MVAYILPADPLLPPPDPGGGVKMSKLTFSKHGHVAYQLKWNHKCSHMVANISPADPPPPGPWGQKVKIKLFHNIFNVAFQKESRMQQHGSKCRQRYNK